MPLGILGRKMSFDQRHANRVGHKNHCYPAEKQRRAQQHLKCFHTSPDPNVLCRRGFPGRGSQYFHHVARAHSAAVQHFGKYALGGHDAFAHGVEYLAMTVAFLADLRNFQQHVMTRNAGSHRQSGKINTVHYQIFSKTAVGDQSAPSLEGLNGLPRKQTHLTVPVARMSITFDAMIFNNICLIHGLFGCAFFLTGANGYDLAHTTFPLLSLCLAACKRLPAVCPR